MGSKPTKAPKPTGDKAYDIDTLEDLCEAQARAKNRNHSPMTQARAMNRQVQFMNSVIQMYGREVYFNDFVPACNNAERFAAHQSLYNNYQSLYLYPDSNINMYTPQNNEVLPLSMAVIFVFVISFIALCCLLCIIGTSIIGGIAYSYRKYWNGAPKRTSRRLQNLQAISHGDEDSGCSENRDV